MFSKGFPEKISNGFQVDLSLHLKEDIIDAHY